MPTVAVNTSTATAMMLFVPVFSDVRTTLKEACSAVELELKTADDIWRNSILIQDIFDLIAKSCIIIDYFTGKNPAVMYETGVAHALKKK